MTIWYLNGVTQIFWVRRHVRYFWNQETFHHRDFFKRVHTNLLLFLSLFLILILYILFWIFQTWYSCAWKSDTKVSNRSQLYPKSHQSHPKTHFIQSFTLSDIIDEVNPDVTARQNNRQNKRLLCSMRAHQQGPCLSRHTFDDVGINH